MSQVLAEVSLKHGRQVCMHKLPVQSLRSLQSTVLRVPIKNASGKLSHKSHKQAAN